MYVSVENPQRPKECVWSPGPGSCELAPNSLYFVLGTCVRVLGVRVHLYAGAGIHMCRCMWRPEVGTNVLIALPVLSISYF